MRFYEVGLLDEIQNSKRDFLQARNLQALSMLDGGDVIAGFKSNVVVVPVSSHATRG